MRTISRVTLLVAVSFLFCCVGHAQTAREKIAFCLQHGARNVLAMQACSGLVVLDADVQSCMGGRTCLGEPPFQITVPPPTGFPFCGSAGMAPCPLAKGCGYPDTIMCEVAQACGSPPYPVCAVPQNCGIPGNLECAIMPTPNRVLPAVPANFDDFRPTVNVGVPQSGGVPDNQLGFAAPNIPDLQTAAACHAHAETEEGFFACLAGASPNSAYRLTKECLEDNSNDAGAAFVCSTNNAQLQEAYDRVQVVRACSDQLDTSSSDARVKLAGCLGEQFLSEQDQRYANCILQSQTVTDAGICAMTPYLTPEQQIGISCAITTGGQPHAFALCTGGRLGSRELEKCWEGGIGTASGCFGPNNEFRKGAALLNDTARTAFGESSAVYQAVNTYMNSPLYPLSQGNLNALNNVLSDVENGRPGPSNSAVQLVNQAGEVLNSVGQSVIQFADCIFGSC